jgi:hypothetical protein
MTKQKILKIFEQDLDLNQFEILSMAKNGEDFLSLLSVIKIEGIINIMVRKGLLDEDKKITEKGEKTYLSLVEKEEVVVEEVKKENSFQEYCNNIHVELKKRLKELTGKDNKYLDSNKYLIPSAKVIEKRLGDAYKIYKFNLDEKVLKVLLQHIEKCVKSNFFKVRTIEYFILGQNSTGSDLDTAIDNYQEAQEEDKKQEITVKDTKSLF